MTGPKTQTDKTSDREWLENFKKLEFSSRSQVVIAWDGANLVVEAPGLNGSAREKIEGLTLADLPGEIQQVLVDRLAKIKSERRQAPQAPRIDPEIERQKRNEAARIERDRKFAEWLDSLPADQRANEERKRVERLEKARLAEEERARQVWLMTARDHDIDLANRVITDPNRRPRRKIVVISQDGTRREISPRATDTDSKSEKKIRRKGIGGKPVAIEL